MGRLRSMKKFNVVVTDLRASQSKVETIGYPNPSCEARTSRAKSTVGTLFPQTTPGGINAAKTVRSLVCPVMSQKPARGSLTRALNTGAEVLGSNDPLRRHRSVERKLHFPLSPPAPSRKVALRRNSVLMNHPALNNRKVSCPILRIVEFGLISGHIYLAIKARKPTDRLELPKLGCELCNRVNSSQS